MEKEKQQIHKSSLPQFVVQIVAWFALAVLFYFDKMQHMILPPLNDLWYAALLGLASGEYIKDIVDKYLKK